MSIRPEDLERHLSAHGWTRWKSAADFGGMHCWLSDMGDQVEVPQHTEYDDWQRRLTECLCDMKEAGIPYQSVPETPGVLEDRPYPASGQLLSSTPIQRCALCTAPATVHLPPQLGASALCRACADRIRAELTPPDEAHRRALATLADRPSPVPRCTCEECRRG